MFVDESVPVMIELQDLETHLNRVKDFTGSRPRMSSTMSSGTRLRIVLARDIRKGPKFKVLGFDLCFELSVKRGK